MFLNVMQVKALQKAYDEAKQVRSFYPLDRQRVIALSVVNNIKKKCVEMIKEMPEGLLRLVS